MGKANELKKYIKNRIHINPYDKKYCSQNCDYYENGVCRLFTYSSSRNFVINQERCIDCKKYFGE